MSDENFCGNILTQLRKTSVKEYVTIHIGYTDTPLLVLVLSTYEYFFEKFPSVGIENLRNF